MRLLHEDAERERVTLTDRVTLGDELGESEALTLPDGEGDELALGLPECETDTKGDVETEPEGAAEPEDATDRDRATDTVGVEEAHRVVLLVSVPERLALRERVTVGDTEELYDEEREREGLLLWLGECVALTLALALGDPLPLYVALALDDRLSRLAL